ncbi:MAG: enoyl-CoA hydratase-isomerase [Candidatus Thorarchaeota archaeon]|nr:MAG: enoyl-CoA hydratase-isomerase [Candidatus Thorarchaeota archaeon]
MSEEVVLYSVDSSIATITINRPKKYNALNSEVVKSLHEAFNKAEDDQDVRVIILTGAGEKAFAAGADIGEFQDKDGNTVLPLAENGQNLCKFIESMSKPVIAAVNGFALGGGCEIAMACDIRYASTNARFGQPEINLGIIPGFGGTVRLPRIVGMGIAKELVYTGDQIKAEEALRIGLINRMFVSVEELMEGTKQLATNLAAKPGVAIRLAKESLNNAFEMTLEKNLEFEVRQFSAVFNTEDKQEGVDAFLAKREPSFKHK